MTVEVELAGQAFTLLNGGPRFTRNPTVSFFVELPDVAGVDRVAGALLEGGSALMPLDTYPWSARYAWVVDRFGVSWQVMHSPAKTPRIVPCLMFSDVVHGRAEEALRRYVEVLGGEILMLEHYGPGAGPEGTLVHGRAAFGGGELVAMDSHITHDVAFDEGISLQVLAPDQATLDLWWDALSQGGRPGVCGWLTDRYGLSWQVVPESIHEWLTSTDTAARDRVFRAMMTMTRPDIATLEAAFRGS